MCGESRTHGVKWGKIRLSVKTKDRITYHYFLALRNLTVIEDCCKLVREKEPDFDIEKIPLDDKNVYKMLSTGGTEGVFQFESYGMTSVLKRMKPGSIEDLTAALSLYRPGPMDSIDTYIENKAHPERVACKHPLLKDILKDTYGCLVYQEQVMMICTTLAGYSYGRADIVRRAMSKKKPEAMAKERDSFVKGAVERGVNNALANEIFDEMEKFASYAFNKSHGVAYSIVAYRTAYLRYYYYKEYMISLITSVMGNREKTAEYINDLYENNVKLLPPHVNYSNAGFSIETDSIRYGLKAIKNMGIGIIEGIIEERSKGKYTSLYDFCSRMSPYRINKTAVESLIKSGALDGLGNNRREMMLSYEMLLNSLSSSYSRVNPGQMSLFDEEETTDPGYEMTVADEYDGKQLLLMEKEVLGIYLSGHPTDTYRHYAKSHGFLTLGGIISSEDGKTADAVVMVNTARHRTTKRGEEMGNYTLEDASAELEAMLFPKSFPLYKDILRPGEIVLVNIRVSKKDEDDITYIINSAKPVTGEMAIKPKTLYVQFESRADERVARFKKLIDSHKGHNKVVVCFKDTRETFTLSPQKYTDLSPDLMKQLENLCGSNNILIK